MDLKMEGVCDSLWFGRRDDDTHEDVPGNGLCSNSIFSHN